jgi:hypothetical protein
LPPFRPLRRRPIPRRQIATTCNAEKSNVYYEQVATHWGNWANIFFNNKGVVAKGDMSVWDWTA